MRASHRHRDFLSNRDRQTSAVLGSVSNNVGRSARCGLRTRWRASRFAESGCTTARLCTSRLSQTWVNKPKQYNTKARSQTRTRKNDVNKNARARSIRMRAVGWRSPIATTCQARSSLRDRRRRARAGLPRTARRRRNRRLGGQSEEDI